MAWELLRVRREHHSPWHARDAAVEFPVDEVAETPKEKPGCAGQRERVSHLPERNAMYTREHGARRRKSDQGTVKRQSPVPDPNEFQGVVQIVSRLVYN